MNTPIYDFVRAYTAQNALRLHMPGHKGASLLGCEKLDITEIEGADSLYHANGIILESEKNASSIFGTAHTFYSTEGSSLCIRAMLCLIKRHAEAFGAAPRILAGRNAHKTFITAAALLGIEVDWLYPENGSYLACQIDADKLDAILSASEAKPTAVYLTSPDYLGNVSDVAEISRVCRAHGVLLAVDNAHGAYLKLLSPSRHPIDLGADICCDSAHKTLPVLTGGAYLHISKNAPSLFADGARSALSLFGSTSPSYLILESLDLANRYISEGYPERLSEFVRQLDALKARLSDMGFALMGNEPLKLTISAREIGYTGDGLAFEIAKRGGVCEFSDPDFTVMMLTPELCEDGLQRLERILSDIKICEPLKKAKLELPRPQSIISPQKALFSDSEELPVDACEGRIQAEASVSCPPAVPIVVCGEEIDRASVKMLKYYGIKKCRVVKK